MKDIRPWIPSKPALTVVLVIGPCRGATRQPRPAHRSRPGPDISHYLRLIGTRIDFVPLDADTTEVTLTVRFERKLDPAWYFGPLERYGVREMAAFLIDEMIVR